MKRILFVDDEVRSLESLRQVLHPLRDEWEMCFTASGEAALERMRAEPFDVIVSDMHMPGMTGDLLLRHVRDEFPQTVRLVVSSDPELGDAQRAAGVVHQFLPKPCSTEELQAVVERSCRLTGVLEHAALATLASTEDGIPPAPRILHGLQDALAKPTVSFSEITAIIESVPATAERVLQLVNSCLFALQRHVGSLREAIHLLGIAPVRNLILHEELQKAYAGPLPESFPLLEHQRHSVLASAIARRITLDPSLRALTTCAALVHDVGQLIFARRVPETYGEVLERAASEEQPVHVIERDVFGVCHGQLGAWLLRAWGLPAPVVEAVAWHHEPLKAGEPALDVLGLTHVATSLAENLTGGSLTPAFVTREGLGSHLASWKAHAASESARIHYD